MEAGPLKCKECHEAKTVEAQKQEELARRFVPAKMKLGHLASQFGPAPFDHSQHVGVTEHCDECHHHSKDFEVAPPCRSCHNTAETEAGSKRLGLKDAYHKQCMDCHKKQGKGPMGCTECHPANAKLPEEIELGSLSDKYDPAPFDHGVHTDAVSDCSSCHHASTKPGKMDKCGACHLAKPGPDAKVKMGLKKAYHKQCIGCHKESDEGPTECTDCHAKK